MGIPVLPFSQFKHTSLKVAGNPSVINPRTLGDRMRKRRLELGLLQKDVAEIIGVNEENVYLWENGHAEPLVRFYPKIIQFLGYFPFEVNRLTLGGRITYYRYINGITPKAFGKLVKADPSTVLAWEYDRNVPHKQRRLLVERITRMA